MTDERFQLLIQESLLRQQKRREKEDKKKAILREKKRKAREKAKRQEKPQQKAKETHFQTFYIYNDKFIERETAEGDLYQTREELEAAMPHNINWKLWDNLINEMNK